MPNTSHNLKGSWGIRSGWQVSRINQDDAYSRRAIDNARELSIMWTSAHPIVSAYIRASIRDFHRAEDLLQDTAANVAEKYCEYDRTRPFLPWALGFAHNNVLHHLRT
ncbi:MAG: hypothetical protein M3552_21165, partial [Planctomycetota bacterium]|nr:hypothetical protein [Planctomycetota bacterium]